MTEVTFHFNAPDKTAYVCRLLRKAVASGARVVVTAGAQELQALDVALWTFAPLDFVPHCRASAEPAMLACSPVLLTRAAPAAPHQQVLVNMGDQVPEGFERFERLIEIVGVHDDDRVQARGRWKHYADRGYAITRHDVASRSPER
ncbi:MAG TPA: DNA polymerase III subunit chi [Rhodoferax sp.]|jgi:DNA polymerase-3 subunit chi|nr:DNA polymerase III subunit chi [Rhodoferax sp.]